MGKPQRNTSAEKQTTTDETSDKASASTRLDASSDQDEAPTRTNIVAAINQLNKNVDSKFELLNASIAGLKQSLGEVEQRVISTEGGLNEHETRIKALEDQCSRWAEEARSLNEQVDDLVSRSRRQNMWIIGVKEGMEKGNPT
ncbi:hypothetical protein CesoFtcFv8_010788 [Champsocephalus esox]|uniref:Uncharacterized protein n=1 Tax=Champsocephalus esox TaxID=159716 RepID=A0AAN8C2T7_9TELE|nr:hypothetical protein CesoFtcFv8_010788 [Champsocephalus esox]